MKPANLLCQQLLTYFAKTNDETALAMLWERHRESLVEWIEARYVANRSIAENVANETFIKLRETCREYDESKPFSDWLYKIAGNVAIIHIGKKRRAERSALTALVKALPELERQVLTLLFLDNLTESAAAKNLGISRYALRMRFNSALAKLNSEYRLSA
jgi:DNA-directed RNA polymerase specialized sigma24 family protein